MNIHNPLQLEHCPTCTSSTSVLLCLLQYLNNKHWVFLESPSSNKEILLLLLSPAALGGNASRFLFYFQHYWMKDRKCCSADQRNRCQKTDLFEIKKTQLCLNWHLLSLSPQMLLLRISNMKDKLVRMWLKQPILEVWEFEYEYRLMKI